MITRFIKKVVQAWAYAICALLFSSITSAILASVFYIAGYAIANKSIPALLALIIAVPAAVWLIQPCCCLFCDALDYLDPTYCPPGDKGE